MLQKISQVICKASKCDLKFGACVLHAEQALHRETLEGMAVIPNLIVLDLEGSEPASIGGVLVSFGRHHATLGIGDVTLEHEHAIQFGVVVCVDVVLIPLLEVLLHDFPDGSLVEYHIVLAVSVILAEDGRIGKHERPCQHTAFPCFGESLRGLGEGLEGFLDCGHINEGHELHSFVNLIDCHPIYG